MANIDLSHLRVLRAGINSGADWILVIEDDGVAENLSEVATNLELTISFAGIDKSDTFMNLSQSMSEGELGIEAIMSRAKGSFSLPGRWEDCGKFHHQFQTRFAPTCIHALLPPASQTQLRVGESFPASQ